MKDIYFKFVEKFLHKGEIVEEYISENPHRDSNEIRELCMDFLFFIENKYFMQELFKNLVDDNPTSIFANCDYLEPIPEDLSEESITK